MRDEVVVVHRDDSRYASMVPGQFVRSGRHELTVREEDWPGLRAKLVKLGIGNGIHALSVIQLKSIGVIDVSQIDAPEPLELDGYEVVDESAPEFTWLRRGVTRRGTTARRIVDRNMAAHEPQQPLSITGEQ